MSRKLCLTLVILITFGLTIHVSAKDDPFQRLGTGVRPWSNNEGKVIYGDVIKISPLGDEIDLRLKDGRIFPLSVASLSKPDQAVVAIMWASNELYCNFSESLNANFFKPEWAEMGYESGNNIRPYFGVGDDDVWLRFDLNKPVSVNMVAYNKLIISGGGKSLNLTFDPKEVSTNKGREFDYHNVDISISSKSFRTAMDIFQGERVSFQLNNENGSKYIALSTADKRGLRKIARIYETIFPLSESKDLHKAFRPVDNDDKKLTTFVPKIDSAGGSSEVEGTTRTHKDVSYTFVDDWQDRIKLNDQAIASERAWVNREGKKINAALMGYSGTDLIVRMRNQLVPIDFSTLLKSQQVYLLNQRLSDQFRRAERAHNMEFWLPKDNSSRYVFYSSKADKNNPKRNFLAINGYHDKIGDRNPERFRLRTNNTEIYSLSLKTASYWTNEGSSAKWLWFYLAGNDLKWAVENLPAATEVIFRFDSEGRTQTGNFSAEEMAHCKEAVACYMWDCIIKDQPFY